MIKIPLTTIIEKIKENSSLSEEDINKKIDEKMIQLSGLISKEGAAHIISNELGIKLFEETSGKLQIKNILAGMRNVETVGKIQQIYPVNEFQRKDGATGKVCSVIIADETSQIRIVLWGSQTDISKDLKQGDIIKIESGYARENNNKLEVHLNDRSKLTINPEGEVIGEVKETTSTRKKISELNESDSDVELLGTIVQVFEPRFFEVCPECNKRVRQRDEGFFCEAHNTVTPTYSYVLNLIMDDGSETIRTVFFRNQLQNLLNIEHEKIVAYKDEPEKFEEIKTSLLGNIIKISGRVNKNEMFDRLEFVTRLVFANPDPKEEIERLKQDAENKPTEQKVTETPTQETSPEPKQEEVKQETPVQPTEQKVTETPTQETTQTPQNTPEEIKTEEPEKVPSFEDI